LERNSGLRGLLARPALYELFQRAVGAPNVRRVFVEEYVRPRAGERVLDIGCGPGDLLRWLPEVEYVGFDPNEHYIASARERFGDRATFVVVDVSTVDATTLGRFDLVLAKGVLHHIDAAPADRLFGLAAGVLGPSGRVVTIDPCYSPRQSSAARAVVARDRGANVRHPVEYEALARRWFDDVRVHEHHDLLRVPYSHLVVVATGARVPQPEPVSPAPTRAP
jgi:SAM-dependent methyltransferase